MMTKQETCRRKPGTDVPNTDGTVTNDPQELDTQDEGRRKYVLTEWQQKLMHKWQEDNVQLSMLASYRTMKQVQSEQHTRTDVV